MRYDTDLDQADVAILATLKKDARISNKDLAETVGLAPSTCLERVRRLSEIGAIHGFHGVGLFVGVVPKEGETICVA